MTVKTDAVECMLLSEEILRVELTYRRFVCAVRTENKAMARLHTYQSDTAMVEDGATIWEAARAASVASGIFGLICIGKHG